MTSTSPLVEIFERDGYLIISDIINSEIQELLAKRTLERIVEIIFGSTDVLEIYGEEMVISMLTNEKLRIETLGESGAKIIYRYGLTRQPILSKSTGMIDLHYLPEVLEHVAFNPKLYELISMLYGTSRLVFKAGLERLCFKAPGSTVMAKHIDMCPFETHKNVNYDHRIQCFVVGSMADVTKYDPKDCGGLSLMIGFHHYIKFFSALCHPKSGLVPFPDSESSYSRFFVLPPGFDKKYLPEIQFHIEAYTQFLHQNIIPSDFKIAQFYNSMKEAKINVPLTSFKLQWTAIPMKSGDVIFWKQELPHYNNANKTPFVRTCFYYSPFPVNDEWYQSEEREWLVKQIKSYRFSYGVNANVYPTKSHNPEEMKLLNDDDFERSRVEKIINGSELSRKLCGF